jgi:hypothetical protein
MTLKSTNQRNTLSTRSMKREGGRSTMERVAGNALVAGIRVALLVYVIYLIRTIRYKEGEGDGLNQNLSWLDCAGASWWSAAVSLGVITDYRISHLVQSANRQTCLCPTS